MAIYQRSTADGERNPIPSIFQGNGGSVSLRGPRVLGGRSNLGPCTSEIASVTTFPRNDKGKRIIIPSSKAIQRKEAENSSPKSVY
jgi:hypothetical protein